MYSPFPSHADHGGDTNLRLCSPQADSSLLCEITDTGLVHRMVHVFMSQLLPVPSYTVW